MNQGASDGIRGATEDAGRRTLERGWRERHIRGQADGSLPLGRIQMRSADGSLVFDRLGRPRMWSRHVADATQPGLCSRVLAARRARAEQEARVAAETWALLAQVQPALRPFQGPAVRGERRRAAAARSGRRDRDERARGAHARTAGGGRAAPGCRACGGGRLGREDALAAALLGLAPKLTAIGLRLDRRKAGLRMAKGRGSA